jgi:hypothetical protein
MEALCFVPFAACLVRRSHGSQTSVRRRYAKASARCNDSLMAGRSLTMYFNKGFQIASRSRWIASTDDVIILLSVHDQDT